MQQIHLSISAGSQKTWKLHPIVYTPKAELNRIPFPIKMHLNCSTHEVGMGPGNGEKVREFPAYVVAGWLHWKDPSLLWYVDTTSQRCYFEAEKHRLWKFQCFRSVSPALRRAKPCVWLYMVSSCVCRFHRFHKSYEKKTTDLILLYIYIAHTDST